MSGVTEVPLLGSPRAVLVTLNGVQYTLRTSWVSGAGGGWFLDIGDPAGAPIACGIALVPGIDLLRQLAYLSIGGRGCQLYLYSDGSASRPPAFGDLGLTSHLVFTEPA